jgi:hypothetical protein
MSNLLASGYTYFDIFLVLFVAFVLPAVVAICFIYLIVLFFRRPKSPGAVDTTEADRGPPK